MLFHFVPSPPPPPSDDPRVRFEFIILKPRELISRVGRVHLRDIPVLYNASPVQTVNIGECHGAGVLVHAHVDEADVVVEVVALHRETRERNDSLQLGGVGVAALGVEGVVLGQIDGDVVHESPRRVFVRVQLGHEVAEDGPLLRRRGGARGAVGWRGLERRSGIGRIVGWRR